MVSISFVIPCYNEEANIAKCINAIHAEANRYWGLIYEVIIVDNNCTDKTIDIAIKQNKCGPVRIIHEPRKGVVYARQAGYKAARHDLIANIDADSFLPRNWIGEAINTLIDKKIIAVTGPLNYIENGKLVKFATNIFYKIAWVAHHIIGPSIQGGNCIIRKSALDAVGGYDTNFKFYGEDTRTASILGAKFGRRAIRMNHKMWIWSSNRRMAQQGFIYTTWIYIMNYLWVSIFAKPATKDYKDYR